MEDDQCRNRPTDCGGTMTKVRHFIQIDNFVGFNRIVLESCDYLVSEPSVVFVLSSGFSNAKHIIGDPSDIKGGSYVLVDCHGVRSSYRVAETHPKDDVEIKSDDKDENLMTCDVCFGIYPKYYINPIDDKIGTDVAIERYKCNECEISSKAVIDAWAKRWGIA